MKKLLKTKTKTVIDVKDLTLIVDKTLQKMCEVGSATNTEAWFDNMKQAEGWAGDVIYDFAEVLIKQLGIDVEWDD